MRKNYKKLMLAALCSGIAGVAFAQESVTAITPLEITDGMNADVIAEKIAKPSDIISNYETWTLLIGTYINPYAPDMVDDDNDNGRSAFYTTDVQEEGAIKYTNDGYLAEPIDNIQYKLKPATEKNALKLTGTKSGTLTLSRVGSTEALPVASAIYLLATAADGWTEIKIEVLDANNNVLGTATATIGDWWSGHESTKLVEVCKTKRISMKGKRPANWFNGGNYGTGFGQINFINGGETGQDGRFSLQRVPVSTMTDSSISKIKITRTGGEKTTSTAVIFAATAVTEEVTLKESETSLDYLINERTGQRIAETVKYKVNLQRSFKPDTWNALILPFSLTVKQAKAMFGEGIKLSKVTDQSFVKTRVVFYPVDMSDDNKTAIERNEYYLISNVTKSEVIKDDSQVYSLEYLQYYNPSGPLPTKTVTNTDGSGTTVTFHGSYVGNQKIGAGSYALSGGKFYRYTDSPNISGFRFWFTEDGTSAESPSNLEFEIDGGTPTGITTIESSKTAEGKSNNVYSMDGRVVRRGTTSLEGLERGIYIVNNKKVIVK